MISNGLAPIKKYHRDLSFPRTFGGLAVLGAIVSFAFAWGSLQNQTMNNTKAIDKLEPAAINAAIQQGTKEGTKEVLQDVLTQLQQNANK